MSKNRVHSKGKLIVHIILVSKYCKNILTGAMEERLKTLIRKICKQEKLLILAMECDIYHIHTLIEYPKSLSISYIVQKFKTGNNLLYKKRIYVFKACLLQPKHPLE